MAFAYLGIGLSFIKDILEVHEIQLSSFIFCVKMI